MTETTTVDRRLAMAEAYVRTRFYPPLPHEYGQHAIEAVDACNEGDPERTITLSGDLPMWPRGAEENAEGDMEVSAAELVAVLRLEHMIEDDDEFDMAE